MEKLEEILKRTGITSTTNSPTSSEPDAGKQRDNEEICPICGGDGWIAYDLPTDHPDFGKLFPCRCRIGKMRSDRLDALRRAGNLEALADKTFESFKTDLPNLTARQAASLRSAYELAERYARSPEGWLLLLGTYGCGKTHLAAAIANYRLGTGHEALFIAVPDLLDHLRATFGPNSDVDYDELFERVRNVPLLILDDLGAESPTRWATEKLYQVFNHRYVNKLPTVVTTNCDLEEIDGRIRSRLVDRSLTRSILIKAPDYRRIGPDAQGGLSSLALHADMTFDNFSLRKNELPKEEQENLRNALETAKAYAEDRPNRWLVFLGTYGCGKTHLAAAIANRRREMGDDVLFVTVPDLLDHLRATFAPTSRASYDERFQQVRTAQLLVLDDLGTENTTPWAREKLFQLINYRYLARLPTVITTSYKLSELDPRLASRMADTNRCEVFQIMAPGYRGNKINGSNRKRGRR